MSSRKILVRRPIFPDLLEEMRRHAAVLDNQSGTNLYGPRLAAALTDADALLCYSTDPVDAALIDSAAALRIVANIGVGYDNVDLAACAARGIIVTNTPGVVDDATADFAFALLLAAARRVAEGDRFVRSGGWTATSHLQPGFDVHHRRLGIIGLGRIGKAIAKRAHGFDMDVAYFNRNRLAPDEERRLGVRHESLDQLLAASDFVVLQVPGTAETRHMIGAREIGLMKRSAVLVNTSRGGVVDEGALAAALKAGVIAAAGLDVFEGEPQVDAALLDLPNVVLAPHVASATLATRHAMARRAVDNILAFLRGEEPPDRIQG
jgi:gluconate 2-dehydrogenase